MFLSSAVFFQNLFFKKKEKPLRNIIRMSNGLGPDQARQNVGPDLVPNHLQKLSADDTSRQRVKDTRMDYKHNAYSSLFQ